MAIKKSTATPAAAAPAPVAAPVVEAVSDVVAPVAESTPLDVVKSIVESLRTKLTSVESVVKELKTELKTLEKEIPKLAKASGKRARKVQVAGAAKRTPSGFAKPTLMSDELSAFLELPSGSLLSRTEVTRKLTVYVKSNNLLKETDKRVINPDAALTKLLNIKEGDVVTYFTLQRFLKHHFPKPV